jgi:multiple sugar transport system permease protein
MSAPARRRPSTRAAWIAVAVFGLFAFAPVYWLVKTALTPTTAVFAYPPQFWPSQATLDHFRTFFADPALLTYMKNSVIVSVITAVASLAVSMYMGYAFSKFRFRGRKALMYFVLSSQMFPSALLLVTLYVVFAAFGLLNTYLALVLSFTTFTLPLCVWMLKGFFDTLPNELIEAARVDGASRWRTLHSIVLPLAAPGLVAAGLFAFMRGWNDFIFALTLAGPQHQTLPPGLVNKYIFEAATAWADLMAASLVVSIPVCVAFIALQRFLVGGLTAGAVKG